MAINKIHLAAIAAACSLSAHAQNNVTLWGIVDVNVQHFKSGGAGSQTALGNSGVSSSQLGFRGVEDLGGGHRALFWLEAALNPDHGTGRPTNSNNQSTGAAGAGLGGAQGLVFDRRSYVGLAGPWGEARLGRDFTPSHYNTFTNDPFAQLGVARVGNFTLGSVGTGPLFTTVAASNGVSYWLPAGLGGFYGQLMYAVGENASNAANRDDGTVKAMRLGWSNGTLDIAAATTRTTYASTAAIGDYTYQNIGATYNFGVFKLFGLYAMARANLSAGEVKKNTVLLGAHVPVGSTGRIRVAFSRLDDKSSAGLRNADGSARSSNDATQWGLGYVHDLSKRTALYGTYARVSNKSQGTYAVGGGAAPLPGRDSSGIEIGLRHAF